MVYSVASHRSDFKGGPSCKVTMNFPCLSRINERSRKVTCLFYVSNQLPGFWPVFYHFHYFSLFITVSSVLHTSDMFIDTQLLVNS